MAKFIFSRDRIVNQITCASFEDEFDNFLEEWGGCVQGLKGFTGQRPRVEGRFKRNKKNYEICHLRRSILTTVVPIERNHTTDARTNKILGGGMKNQNWEAPLPPSPFTIPPQYDL